MDALYELFTRSSGACTDTRKLQHGNLYFALKGPNFDGNTYANQALAAGALAAVVDDPSLQGKEGMFFVDDVLTALQGLGTFHRRRMPARVIALTGSNGKTTTKELIYGVLASTYPTQSTQGNLNNHIGVPLTLLSLKEETEFLIVEMGANHQGEIAHLSSIAQPDFGLITNFGKAHLEGFGGVEGVIKGKSELYVYLMSHGGHIFLRADDPIQREKTATYTRKIGYTETEDRDFYRIQRMERENGIALRMEDVEIHPQLPGAFNFYNCAIAALIGRYFNVPLQRIKSAIESYVPDNMRSQLVRVGSVTILMDAYNANPSSMSAAIQSLLAASATSRVAILGDMFELGDEAPAEHQSIAQLLETPEIDQAFLIGSHFYGVSSRHPRFPSFEDFRDHWPQVVLPEGALVLIKGSRGMALERVLELIRGY